MSAQVVPATPEALAEAARLLRAGELVAFPTETVYGLGADAGNPAAVRRIFAAKGRPVTHPVIVHLPDATHLERWARRVPAGARALAEAFWPGPLTLILPRCEQVHDTVTGGQDSVGLRVPAHPVARALLAAFAAAGGHGVAAPSANRFGHVSPTTALHVAEDLGGRVALIIDGGPCLVGIESTIVAFTDDTPVLLRPGGIAVEALTRVLGVTPREPGIDAPRASGTLAAHYAPHTRSRLVPPHALVAEWRQHADRDERVAVLARSVGPPGDFEGAWITAPKAPEAYARLLYAALRELDHAGADALLIEAVPDDDTWRAVRDRLERATGGSDTTLTRL